MFKRYKDLYWKLSITQDKILASAKELEWAHIYHDSIRNNKELENLSLKVGRWAANYSLLYLIHRILVDFKPKNIIEFGLGESTKLISTYNNSIGNWHNHIIIEQDENWLKLFQSNYEKTNYECRIHPLEVKTNLGFEYNGYHDVDKIPTDGDFYIIDGPFGSKHYSRFDLTKIVEKFEKDKEFIIILDDYDRIGEQETSKVVMQILQEKDISFHKTVIEGGKNQFIIVSEKYKYVLTL